MQKWEYLQVVWTNSQDGSISIISNGQPIVARENILYLYQYLNRLGQEGWELVSISQIMNGVQGYHYFKRPVQE
jgi:hypothetical protein